MKKLFALIFLFCPVFAYAQTCTKVADNKVHVCWTAPTTYTDGTAIGSASILYDVQVQQGTNWVTMGSNVASLDWTSAALAPGTYFYRVLAKVGGVTSDPSNLTSKTTTSQQPNPPIVVIASLAYVVKFNTTAWVPEKADTWNCKMPLGAACDSTRTVGGGFYAVVDSSLCKPKPTTGVVRVAKCG